MTELTGRVALVTGASRGIGAAVADALSAAGAKVVRVARSLAPSVRADGEEYACDLGIGHEVERLGRHVLDAYGPPTVLVHAAGGFILEPVERTSVDDFDRQIAVNLRAPFALARAFLPAMREAGSGTFVSIGSVADHAALPGNSAYASSKFGLRGLHETLISEFQGSGVRITLVSPGATDTSVWDPYDPDNRPGFPPRRAMLTPADVAEAVLFVVTRPAGVHVDWLRLSPTSLPLR